MGKFTLKVNFKPVNGKINKGKIAILQKLLSTKCKCLAAVVEKLAAAAVVISVSRAAKAVDIISLLHKALRKVVNKADIIKLHKVAVSRSLKHRQWQSQTLILTMTFRSRQRQN